MNQQVPAAAAAVKPYWIADVVVGVAAALAAVAVAQAALPDRGGERARVQPRAAALTQGGVQRVSAPLDLPDFIYGEPIDGYEVISPFGMRKLPWETAARLHAGVDIAAPSGYPVQAAADGIVVAAGYRGGYGQMVEVKHAEGLTSIYAHLGVIDVRPGMAVKRGDKIAQVGNSGSSTGAHLHFEVHDRKKRPMNPQMFMGREYQTVRDLPLKQAARIPRGVRIAYVSYIPKMKREMMEAREAAKKAAEQQEIAALDAAKAGTAAKGAKGQAVQLPDAPIASPSASWTKEPYKDPYDVGVEMPGWPASS